ncbi:MAG: nicotinate-nucleotide adenylyltransferase [Rhodobacteraceae bacterium]|nr:nicotinate-nucleotide adenylyltransferase [Paracoccaceae bacterium]
MTVERAILLSVGFIVLASVLLAVLVSLNWLWLSGLLAGHLIQASFTGMCPVVMRLKKHGLASKPGVA